jgi:excisionase family DNA binding protein
MTETSPPRRLVTINEAADHAHCGRSTIKRRLADGTLTAYRLGRMVRVDLDQLDAAFVPSTSEQAS